MQPFCQNPQLSRSLESELESASKSGELKLQGKNLKDFPRLGDRYKLQDTTLAGTSQSALSFFNWSIITLTITATGILSPFVLLDSQQTCTDSVMLQYLDSKDLENVFHSAVASSKRAKEE